MTVSGRRFAAGGGDPISSAAPGFTGRNTTGTGQTPLAEISAKSAKDPKASGYGLRHGILSPFETLAQSISGVCPTLTPFVTVPLVFTLAGNGTWLAYIFATGAIFLVAWCIGRFGRHSSSPGSLYSYASMILPPWLATTAAWSLLLAYVAGSASNIGGFYYFADVILRKATGHVVPAILLALLIAIPPVWMAWHDVRISARAMLALEAVSVTLVVAVIVLVLARHGLHGDPSQFHLRGVTPGGFRQGLVLALYSFVGFEAATALGAEARNPLRAIPRAVILTAVLGGLFFTLCAYTEVLGFGMGGKDLATTDVPMHVLAAVGGVPVLGFLIDIGALVSLFAGILAGIIAAARVLLLMSHNGLTHASLRATHERNATPTGATLVTGAAALLPVAIFALKGASGLDVYGWLGMLAVYGFVVSYGLVCFALPSYLRDHHGVENLATKTIPWIAVGAMVFALVANLYPVPEGVYGKLPFVFLAYLAAVLLLFAFRSRAKASVVES
ncbi:MAG TPA: APC family permease [Candidatus Aquilonibacter sp.]|nr:APC family permease [Candidatus Aquilonibacter sp.]